MVVALRPNKTKMVEKPSMNRRVVLKTLEELTLERLRSPLSSATSTPVTTDKYAGTNGRTQGDRKDITPPPKATI
jgi:hypothetical protein